MNELIRGPPLLKQKSKASGKTTRVLRNLRNADFVSRELRERSAGLIFESRGGGGGIPIGSGKIRFDVQLDCFLMATRIGGIGAFSRQIERQTNECVWKRFLQFLEKASN